MKNAVQKLVDNFPTFRASLKHLKSDVLVGVPAEEGARKNGEGMNNATLAYIHDNGSPAANIPDRPFMQPGIAVAKERIAKFLEQGAREAMHGNPGGVEKGLQKAGLTAQASIRAAINAGIPPPLAPSTLAARKARGRTGEKPLIDTGQLRNSISYVVRVK
jgi:phage gpG-like protein